MNTGIVLITGATSGIGASFARHYGQKGYDLILTGLAEHVDPEYANNMMNTYSVKVEVIAADFGKESDIGKIESVIKGRDIDVLVNNAGFGLGRAFIDNSICDIEAMINVHINAPVRFIHAVLPGMLLKNRGTIINLSSLSSFLPIPRDPVYSATKLFQNSLLESLHISLRSKGIKFQVLCPGFVHTNYHNRLSIDQDELKRRSLIPWMQPDDVVGISVKQLKRNNNLFVIPGIHNKIIRVAYRLMPQWLYYRIAAKHLCRWFSASITS